MLINKYYESEFKRLPNKKDTSDNQALRILSDNCNNNQPTAFDSRSINKAYLTETPTKNAFLGDNLTTETVNFSPLSSN